MFWFCVLNPPVDSVADLSYGGKQPQFRADATVLNWKSVPPTARWNCDCSNRLDGRRRNPSNAVMRFVVNMAFRPVPARGPARGHRTEPARLLNAAPARRGVQ